MSKVIWKTVIGENPLIATAIHDGHDVRPEVAQLLELSEEDRLREEDPYTAAWTAIAETRIIGLRSRFEVDLNRPRNKAVYRKPEDAWGLNVWKEDLPEDLAERSIGEYDAFYQEAQRIFSVVAERYGRFVVYDLHTYNHRRDGPEHEPAPPDENPEVNVGTSNMDCNLWTPIIKRFMTDLRAFDFDGRHLDVKKNTKFQGGRFSRWIHENFPGSGCSLAIEFKKFFMDEWTGEKNEKEHQRILDALRSTTPGILEELDRLNKR